MAINNSSFILIERGGQYDSRWESIIMTSLEREPLEKMAAQHNKKQKRKRDKTWMEVEEFPHLASKKGIKSGACLRFRRFQKCCKPKEGQQVIWIWGSAAQATAGDFYGGKCRDAAKNYEVVETEPSHFIIWPKNWPSS